jgi:hypothetical protein
MHQWMLTSNSIQLTLYTDRRFIKVTSGCLAAYGFKYCAQIRSMESERKSITEKYEGSFPIGTHKIPTRVEKELISRKAQGLYILVTAEHEVRATGTTTFLRYTLLESWEPTVDSLIEEEKRIMGQIRSRQYDSIVDVYRYVVDGARGRFKPIEISE